MKRNSTFLLGLALSAFLQLLLIPNSTAQTGTQNDNFLLQVNSAAGTRDFAKGTCGWQYSLFGASVTEEICGDVVWGYGMSGDSLGCDTILNDYKDKIVLLRRKTCNFSIKVYHAQQAGAKAVIIANHYDNATEDGCYVTGMSGGTYADLVTIPCIFVCRDAAEYIDAQIKAGQAQACFVFPRVLSPYAGYHYATPVSQIIPLEYMGLNFINREDTVITDLVITADVHEPGGNVTTLSSTIPTIDLAVDTLLFFDPYTPPAVTGDFDVVMYTNKYSEPRDTLRRRFTQTDYTFALDNIDKPQLDGGAERNDLFIANLLYQVGSLVFTGDNGGLATYATFGVANIDSVYVPGNDLANTLTVFLYDGDFNNNGNLDLENDFPDLEIVGIGTYILNGAEQESVLVDAAISDILTTDPGVQLLPNHNYYISVQYDGTENGSGRNCAFTNSAYQPYLFFVNESGAGVPSAPIQLGGTLSYWSDRTIACRLQMEGYTPPSSTKPSLLDPSQFAVTPNPANEQVRLALNLENPGTDVRVTIATPFGQVATAQTFKNYQNGTITMDVSNVPSGTYIMTIRTHEGVGAKKIAICH